MNTRTQGHCPDRSPRVSERLPGHHHLQIPGPTTVPSTVAAALARPIIDHRGPEFSTFVRDLLPALQRIFRTTNPVVTFASSGSGAWEAALTNVLSPGDRVLAFDSGQFARLWHRMASELGFTTQVIDGDWRHGVPPEAVAHYLGRDVAHDIKAVLVVHNETSTGVTSRVSEIREAIDSVRHPALLMVDAISSLASLEYRHDDWGVDVTVASSQKGLMLPPGLSFNAVSARALEVAAATGSQRSYFAWKPIIDANLAGQFPSTPAISLLFGLRASIDLLEEESLEAVAVRHRRHADATRAAVASWGLELVAIDDRERSDTVTAILVPEGHDADAVRQLILERFNMSLGTGLGHLQGRAFRIGHMGSLDDLTLAGTIAGVEMGLALAGVPITPTGTQSALNLLMTSARPS